MFLDPLYLLVIVATMVLSGGTSLLVRNRFAAGQRVPLRSGLTGRDVARRILDVYGVTGVTVQPHDGFLSDHYNPMTRTLALSPDVFHGRDAAAAGVAAHEVGHALQHARGYAPMWLRSAIVPVANVGSMLGPYIVIAGIALGVAQPLGHTVALVGVALFGAATLFTLVTIPVEFDASARATAALRQTGILQTRAEESAVRGVLLAAGLTYVAAAAGSILTLLYWAHRAGLLGGRSNDR